MQICLHTALAIHLRTTPIKQKSDDNWNFARPANSILFPCLAMGLEACMHIGHAASPAAQLQLSHRSYRPSHCYPVLHLIPMGQSNSLSPVDHAIQNAHSAFGPALVRSARLCQHQDFDRPPSDIQSSKVSRAAGKPRGMLCLRPFGSPSVRAHDAHRGRSL